MSSLSTFMAHCFPIIQKCMCRVCRIKSQFQVEDMDTNPGVVISPRTTHVPYNKLTVKTVVSGDFITEPVMFTCDGRLTSIITINQLSLKVTD